MNTTTAFLVVMVAAGITIANVTSNREIVNICTGFEANQKIPDYTDCSKYYQCSAFGNPISNKCPWDERFDVTKEKCVPSNQVKCFKCPENMYYKDMPVDRNCIQFIRCFADEPRQQTCSKGLLFDPDLEQCNFEHNVTCSCPERDAPSRPVYFRSSDNCAKYRVCANGTSIHAECQKGLEFNMELHQCDFPDVVNCTATPILE